MIFSRPAMIPQSLTLIASETEVRIADAVGIELLLDLAAQDSARALERRFRH